MSSLSAVNDFFNFTKICSFYKKESKTFKIPLSCYSSSSGQCVLTAEEKKKFSITCPICCSVNQLDFTQMRNEYMVKLLQNKIEIESRVVVSRLFAVDCYQDNFD